MATTADAERSSASFSVHLGVRLTSVAPDRVVGELTVEARHLNGVGKVHGGVLMAFADELGARGTVANLPAGCGTTTIESKTNFFRGIAAGVIRGESVPLHRGRNTMVWQTTIFDAEGKRAALVTQTQLVLRPEPTAPKSTA